MINVDLRKEVGGDPNVIMDRSEIAYDGAYSVYEEPPWSNHSLAQPTTDMYLEELKKMAKRPRILDSGCGTGKKSILLADRDTSVIGVDLLAKAIDKARKNLQAEVDRRIREKSGTHLNLKDHVNFMQGDVRRLDRFFGDNSVHGVFDYQCLASIPPEFWPDVSEGYYRILKPKGFLLIDLLNCESHQFHGDISDQLGDSHEYVFKYDPNRLEHKGLDWEEGLYVYFCDRNEAQTLLGENFRAVEVLRRPHPKGDGRLLWSVLMQSNKR